MGSHLAPVLVTGAEGYLGSRVCRLVEARNRSAIAAPRLRDDGAFELVLEQAKPAAVVHCAAVVPKRPGDYGDEQAAATSVSLAKTVAGHARCRVVLASSMTVYGVSPVPPVDETGPLSPASAYACGKRRAEEAVLARQDPRDVIVRLPGLFGLPRRSGVLFAAATTLLRGRSFSLSGDTGAWAALWVDDAAEVLVRAALDATPSEDTILNAGYPGMWSLPAAIAVVARLCGARWDLPAESFSGFAMCLERVQQRLAWRPPLFEERLARFVEDVRRDEQAHGASA